MYELIFRNRHRFAFAFRKSIILLILALFVQYSWANPNKIRIPKLNPTVAEALKHIEPQTEYRFSWDRTFDINKIVELKSSTLSFDELMGAILKGTNKTYVVTDGFVLIKEAPQVVSPQKVSGEHVVFVSKEIERLQTIEGNVTIAESDMPAINVVVTIEGTNQSYTTTTDGRGYFVEPKLPAGDYKVNFSHLDYDAKYFIVTIKEGEDKRLEVSLFPHQNIEQVAIPVSNKIEFSSKNLTLALNSKMKQRLPAFALKTNLIYGALTTLNLGFEVRLSKRSTLDVPFSYNPWVFSDNKRLNHIMVQPEYRL